MITTAPPQDSAAAIVHRLDDLNSPFWREHHLVLPLPSSSVFWTKELASVRREPKFDQLRRATQKTKSVKVGWDGYDAPAPNDVAIAAALEVLSSLLASQLDPYSVLPSANGGVGISFRGRETRRAVLELRNDCAASYTLYGKGHPTEGAPFDFKADLPKILQRLAEFL
jgi:hypothetical protein